MRMLRQLSELLESIPVWGQVLIAAFLVGYSIVSVYGRINTKFGAKAFSRIPQDRIRKDMGHIIQYTLIPVIVTVGFLVMLFLHHSNSANATAKAQESPDWVKSIKTDLEKIYPYVVPEEYLSQGARQPNELTIPLGHDLHITLVHDLGGRVQNVMPIELTKVGLSVEQAWKKADENQAAVIARGEVGGMIVPDGPGNKPFVVFGGYWATAGSITWTGLYDEMRKVLATDDLLVCIPHRDAMLVFSNGSEDYIKSMQDMIREKEKDGRKRLTMELFRLTKEGPKPRNSKE